MPKPNDIELPSGERIPILYEDRSVMAIDKPAGWMLAPDSWQKTARNLQLALLSSMRAGDFWARSRGLRFLRFVHRLDTETSGVLLLAKSRGALSALSNLFEGREVQKVYWAVVKGVPGQREWSCRLKLEPDPSRKGRMKVDASHGKAAETRFQVLQVGAGTALVEARPLTGRTHQIRVHLAATAHPVIGDGLYGAGWTTAHAIPELGRALSPKAACPGRLGEAAPPKTEALPAPGVLALRAVEIAYRDPFTRREVKIRAPVEKFAVEYGFEAQGRDARETNRGIVSGKAAED